MRDVDAYLANFWRAVTAAPDDVAKHADWPVNEADLHARHRWLVESGAERIANVKRDPDFYDAKVAGWWVWGQCLWIGSGWCARPEWTGRAAAGRAARGIHTDEYQQRPDSAQRRRPQLTNDNGVVAKAGQHRWKKKPNLADPGGRGVHADVMHEKRPNLMHPDGKGVHRRWNGGGAGGGSGVHAPRLTKQQVPDLSGSRGATGRGVHATAFEVRSGGLYDYMQALAVRLRRVRVCCGDWSRVVTPAVTTYIGVTGVFLDPPYSHAERAICYSHDNDIGAEVRAWALKHGHDKNFRVALCGYEGEHEMPSSWDVVSWKAGGGYGRSVRGKANRLRERIWFSPHCLPAEAPQSVLDFEDEATA